MNSDPAEPKQEEKEEILITWFSPSRLFKRRNPEYFKTIGAIVFLLTIILVFAGEYILVAAVLSVVFLIYVLSTVPPEAVQHRVTNFGIESMGHFYRWDTLAEFWFEEDTGQIMLVIQPMMGTRIMILLGTEEKEKIKTLISKYLPYREAPVKSWVDKASSWLSEKIPLDRQPQP